MLDWQELAGHLLSVGGDAVEEERRPLWVRVFGPPEGGEDDYTIEVGGGPDGLLGWTATSDCQAVGLVAAGTVSVLGGGPGEDVADPADRRIRLVCILTRPGEMVWKVGLPSPVDGLAHPPEEGRMVDCLRRCFGLPTPPPPDSPARLQVAAWLVAVLDASERARRPMSWSDVAKLHPVAQVLGDHLDRRCATDLTDLVRLAGSAWTWEDYRSYAATEGALDELIRPEVAAWMDDGMFARWVLAELPHPDVLLAAVRPCLAPSAARRLSHAVHVAGQPEPAGTAG